jgi:6-phosphogluconolactonase
MTSQLRVYPTRNDVARAAAAQVVDACDKALTTRGRFTIALSGGSTPRELYRLLATEEYASSFDWQRIHVFWSDERCVPLNSPDNNAHMARDVLLNHVPISISNIHRVQSELEAEAAAQDYEQTLRKYFAARGMQLPQFDLLLLGMGAEGHTASLFPGSQALYEQERWVVATYVDQLESWRVTLTPVALNAATRIIFLVVGEEKSEALKHVLNEPIQPELYPAQIIDPPQGQVLWIVDHSAAALLNS